MFPCSCSAWSTSCSTPCCSAPSTTFHLGLAAGMVAFLALGVVLAAAGTPLGWYLVVVMASPFVVVVGYETVGYRHVSADVQREG